LFIHLFALSIAFATGTDYGGSELLRGVKKLTPGLNSYLTQFWFHRGYDYYLMHDLPLDWTFSIEATVNYADGHSDPPVTIPSASLWPGERQQRYRQLAQSIARYAARAAEDAGPEIQDMDRKSVLAAAIGAAILRSKPDAQSVLIRTIAHRWQNVEEARSQDPKERNPDDPRYFSPFASVIVKLDGDRPVIFEVLPPAEVSPVRTQSGAKPKPSSADKKKADEDEDEN
jgi:hypothetical protein